jgi:outer membrane lipoprotein-sorting protein
MSRALTLHSVRSALLLLPALLLAGSAFAEDAADAVMARVASTYANVERVDAEFTQSAGGTVQKGRIALQKPGSMRWDFDSGDSWISDGTTLWIASPDDRTVTVFKRQDAMLRRFFELLTGSDAVRKDFRVSLIATTSEGDTLKLVSRLPDPVLEWLHVTVDKKTSLVTKVLVRTPFGDETTTVLSEVATGKSKVSTEFRWDGRDGWRTIRGD